MRYLQRLVQFRRFDVFRDFTARQLLRARGYLDDGGDHGHGGD